MKQVKARSNVIPKVISGGSLTGKSETLTVAVPPPNVPSGQRMYKDKPESEVILDTLLKISEKVLAIEKVINDIQKMQKAGRF